jgi:hypothetical protein
MAERLGPLFATQVARAQIPVPARPTFRVEIVAQGARFQALQLGLCNGLKKLQPKVSHILRPGNTAYKEQLKLVNGFEK